MPVLDGYGATRAIREWESVSGRPRVPIVALTAHALKGDRERCLAAGMDDYLAKPLDPDVLAAMLARWLEHPAPPARPAHAAAPSGVPARPPIDENDLLHRCMGRKELAQRLLQKFVQQAQDDLQEIQAALTRQDAPAVATIAHRLKSSAVNVSATRLGELTAELDALGRAGRLGATTEISSRLAQALNEIQHYLTTRPLGPAS